MNIVKLISNSKYTKINIVNKSFGVNFNSVAKT